MWFISYIILKNGNQYSGSGWSLRNAVIREHPLKWLAKQDRDIVKILFWSEVSSDLPSEALVV
jgi:hypothetical protein